MAERLSEMVRLTFNGATGTTAALTGDIIDMASNGGFDRVLFLGYATATNAGQWLKAQVGTASGSLTDSTGEVAHTVNGLYLDLQPNERFVRGVLTAAEASSVYRTLVSVQYGARKRPTSNATASVRGDTLTFPATGTATG